MPCACKKPVEDYPENAEWGPLIWSLLHGLAEYSGKQAEPVIQEDEKRLWIGLLKSLAHTLPCDHCRGHYMAWIRKYPPEVLVGVPYTEVREWIRRWIFTVHNDVNARLLKPVFLYEDLTLKYKGLGITVAWRKLEPVMKIAIQLSGISLLPWKKWLATVRSLQGIYGV